ncbi:hypothetical protein pmac_cds_37 [Pandoravirus macleodensis]|uniref:Uncharacterized protein n=1 Tax=Pandoravirus macleodensis TaxID=2107707 RepID=A0A2U7UEE3_9VIRU|nr:hypothetical protein pmac_cds_37 [Pandoravirus macleodensis]AVK76725.1 hypothetical protein pmac_cds_37 [Pandoravirus macleodensis]UMO79264.1 hypothetical protein [Pandoravirus aubagnensis]
MDWYPAGAAAGAKRRMEQARPDVAAAVGLCVEGDDALSERQRQRLNDIAARLGVTPSPSGTCKALAAALGDEWNAASESADVFAAEEARIAAGRNPPRTPLALDSRLGWADLPPEMRAEVARVLTDVDPRAAVALYASDPENARAFDAAAAHPIWVLDEYGQMVEGRIPLADYARAAAAFGVTNPIDLFLAGATCTLQAFVNWYIANAPAGTFPRARNVAERLEAANAPAFEGGVDFVTVLSRGIDSDQLEQMDVSVLGDAVRGTTAQRQQLSLGRLRTLVGGPLGENLSEVARQWYQFIAAPPALAINAMTPLAVRAGVLLGGRAPSPFGISRVAPMQDVALLLGDWSEADLPGDFVRLRRVFDVQYNTVGPDRIARWLGIEEDDDLRAVLTDWIWSIQWDARANALKTLRDAISDDWDVQEAIVDDIKEAIAPYRRAVGACAAVTSRYPQLIPSFSRLFSGSRIVLEPGYGGIVTVFLDLDSDALDQLLGVEGY